MAETDRQLGVEQRAAQPDQNVVSFGGIQMDNTLYATRMQDIRSDYASALSDINSQFSNLEGQITDLQAGINNELAQNRQLSTQVYERMIGDMEMQITNIQNSQNMQVTQTASQLDSMLAKVADFYEAEVEAALESLTSALEPVMIVFLGFVVGFIVISMFLPLISIISELSSS